MQKYRQNRQAPYNRSMNTVIRLGEPDDKTLRQKTFRKQFADNLNAALDRRGAIPSGYGRVVGVAELFGVSQNTAANWLKGEGVPELFRLPEIAETLNTTIEQLVVGDRGTGAHVIDEHYTVIDVHGADDDESHALYTLPETLRELGLPNGIRMMQVFSDDMEPYVRSGDVVVYDPRINRIHASGVFILNIRDTLFVRRVQCGIRGDIRLICDNNCLDDELLSEADFDPDQPDDKRIDVVGCVMARILIGR